MAYCTGETMKFWIEKDGNRVCVQSVNRGGKIYYRQCAYTMYRPTDRQLNVRTTLMKASHQGAKNNENRLEILRDVRNAFPAQRERYHTESEISEYVKEKYPEYIKYIEVMTRGT